MRKVGFTIMGRDIMHRGWEGGRVAIQQGWLMDLVCTPSSGGIRFRCGIRMEWKAKVTHTLDR